MRLNEYQRLAARTIPAEWDQHEMQNHSLLGMVGELGELAVLFIGITGKLGMLSELFKKHWYQGHELPMAKVQEELADILWHWFEMVTACGWTAEDVADALEAKLQKRYPGNGFSSEDSIARVDHET